MVSRWALAACLIQLMLAAVVGEAFPISRYTMYARIAPQERMSVPLVLIDGQPGEITDYVDFDGLDVSRWTPPAPCSLGYQIHDVDRWIESHRGGGGDVEIALGFVVVTVHDGTITEERVVLQRGHARAAQ